MNNGGEAADQMVREALQVTEVAIKLSALGIKNALALSLAYAKENPKVKGKTSLDRLLREGKELKIIALQSKDVGQFKELAKQYGVLFAVVKDKAQNEKVDVMFKAEDVSKLNRIYEQLGYVFSICNGIVTDMADSMGGISEAMVSLPAEMQTAIENVGFLASIPLWLVTILGSLFITVLSFVMILTVYGRFFRLYMYTALAPLPLAAFAGESTQSVGISFLKSYVGVCLEGAVIVLACVIYSAFVGTPTVTGGEATTIVWSYLAETVFNMLVLVGLIKGSDRIIHEMMGL